jgi:hypothetical protein
LPFNLFNYDLKRLQKAVDKEIYEENVYPSIVSSGLSSAKESSFGFYYNKKLPRFILLSNFGIIISL